MKPPRRRVKKRRRIPPRITRDEKSTAIGLWFTPPDIGWFGVSPGELR